MGATRQERGPGGPARRLREAASAAALMGALLLAAGCGIFEPEKPERPDTGAGVTLPDLTVDPESTLKSFRLGLTEGRSEYYYHALADTSAVSEADFHAVFDPQDAAQYQLDTGVLPPDDWASADEKTFFSYFATEFPVDYTVYLYPDTTRNDIRGSDVATLYRRYRIYAGAVPVAVGLADLTLRRLGVSGEWKLTYWEDRRDTSATSIYTYGRWRLRSLSF